MPSRRDTLSRISCHSAWDLMSYTPMRVFFPRNQGAAARVDGLQGRWPEPGGPVNS